MNLTTDGWIPVASARGERALLSLRQVFAEGHQWQDLAVRPHERVALMRLLICVAQQSLLEASSGCWRRHDETINKVRREPRGLTDPAISYLDLPERRESFFLFDPHKPFLQFAGLTRPAQTDGKAERRTDVSKLDFTLATGDKSTLFDHGAASEESRDFAPLKLALMLITFQCFALSQPAASLELNGVLVPSKDGKPASKGKTYCGHGPCLPAAMFHSFLRKGNLLETVAWNLLSSQVVGLYRVREDGEPAWGEPVWQWMPASFDDAEAIANATTTYLGRLMPLSRCLLLNPNCREVLLANGLDYPSANVPTKSGTPCPYPPFPPEPSATLSYSEKAGFKLVGGSRSIWRELPALVVKRKAQQSGGALTLIDLSGDDPFDLWVGGMIATKDEGIVDTTEGVYEIPTKVLRDEGRKAYEGEVLYADQKVSSALSFATATYRQLLELKPQSYPEQAVALRHYWNAVEQLLPMLNSYIAAEDGSRDQVDKRKAWRSALWKTARDSYAAACAFETPRQKRAYSLGLRALQFTQRKTDQPAAETQEAA